MEKEKDGVWRTIRGRRIFIAKGESLGEAMSKSGKFNRSDIRETKAGLSQKDKFDRTNSQSLKQRQKAIKDFRKKDTRYSNSVYTTDRKDEKNRINENAPMNKDAKTRVERNKERYSETDRRELRREELQKRLDAEKLYNKNRELYHKHGGFYNKENNEETNNAWKEWLNNREKARKLQDNANNEDTRKLIREYQAKKQSNNKIGNVKREISYIGQDGKEHKMNEYKYPGEKYENWLKNKYGTDKEEEIIAKDRNKSYSRLRDEYYYENDTTPKKEALEREQSNNHVDNEKLKSDKMNATIEKRQKIIEDLDNKTRDLSDYDKYNLAVSKLENEDYKSATERQYWVGTRDRYVENEKTREKEIDKQSNNNQDWRKSTNPKDWDDINHWYNDDPREEWNKQSNNKQETIKNYVEKKQSNNHDTTNRILEGGKVNQKTLKSYAKDGLATDISNYSDKELDKLEKKHGKIRAIKTTNGVYGMNGGLFRGEKSGKYFVITSRSGNLYRLV